jgi:hypothetical protein
MFTEDSAAVTAAIRAGNIQQIQAEPTRRHSAGASGSAPRVLVAARVGGPSAQR